MGDDPLCEICPTKRRAIARLKITQIVESQNWKERRFRRKALDKLKDKTEVDLCGNHGWALRTWEITKQYIPSRVRYQLSIKRAEDLEEERLKVSNV